MSIVVKSQGYIKDIAENLRKVRNLTTSDELERKFFCTKQAFNWQDLQDNSTRSTCRKFVRAR